jgi:cell division protein ZapA (FtsZ GTPase activity inhibitor)
MQIKGSKYTIFCTHQIPPNLHFANPLAKQNEKIKLKHEA